MWRRVSLPGEEETDTEETTDQKAEAGLGRCCCNQDVRVTAAGGQEGFAPEAPGAGWGQGGKWGQEP